MGDLTVAGLAALFHDPLIKALIINRGIKHREIGMRAYRSVSAHISPKHLYLADVISSYLDRTLYLRERVSWGDKNKRNIIVMHPISCRSFSICTLRDEDEGGESAMRNIIEMLTGKLANSTTYEGHGRGFKSFFGHTFSHSLRCLMTPSTSSSGESEGSGISHLLKAMIAKPGFEKEFFLLVWRWMHLIYYHAFLQAVSPSNLTDDGLKDTSSDNHQGNQNLRDVLTKNKREILFILDKVLPADTRSPYNPITDHLESTAAISAILESEEKGEKKDGKDEDGSEKGSGRGLASLHFSLRGIDEFLAESRTTADFWASSFIVSYLTWSSMRRLLESGKGAYSPANVVYPAQRGSPWMDTYIMKKISQKIGTSDGPNEYMGLLREEGFYDLLSGVLRPALPGIFLAWISSEDESSARKEVLEGFGEGLEAIKGLLKEFSGNVGFKSAYGDDKNTSLFALRPNILTIKWYGIDDRELDEIKNLLTILSRAYPDTPAGWHQKFQETWKKYSYSLKKNKRNRKVFENFREFHYAHIHQLGRSVLKEAENTSYEVQEEHKCTVCGWRTAIVEWSPLQSNRHLEEYLRPRERLCPVCLTKRIIARGLPSKDRASAITKLLEEAGLYLDDRLKKELESLVGRFPSTDDIASSPYVYLVESLTGESIGGRLKAAVSREVPDERAIYRLLNDLKKWYGYRRELMYRKYLDDLITFIHYVRNIASKEKDWVVGSLLYEDVYNRVDRALSGLSGMCRDPNTDSTEDLNCENLKRSLSELSDLKEILQAEVRKIGDEAVKEAAKTSDHLAEALSRGPSNYYSVLVANVDGVNLFVIGRIGPTIKERIHPKVVRKLLEEEGIEEFLESRAPITPTGHKALSRLLTHFLLFVAPDKIERYPDFVECPERALGKNVRNGWPEYEAKDGGSKELNMGRVVLAGGDQVYALLPGSESPFVAVKLEEEFAKPVIRSGGRYFYGSDGTITVSSALVIAHRFFPVGEAFRRAKELLRKTKELRRIHTPMWPSRPLPHCPGERLEGWIGMELVTRSYNTRRAILPAPALRATLDLVGLVRGRGPCHHYCPSDPKLSRNFIRDIQMVSRFSGNWELIRRMAKLWARRNALEGDLDEDVEGTLDRVLDVLQDYGSVAERKGSSYKPLDEFLQALLIVDKVTG